MKKAVFLERDGILNEVTAGPREPVIPLTFGEFTLIKGADEPITLLRKAGFVVIVIMNQPGLSGGYLSRRELERMHEVLRLGVHFDDLMICPHAEADHCPCHLPRPGLLIEAAFKWHINLDHSFVVSNHWRAAEAARTAGCTSLLLKSPWVGRVHHDFVLGSLADIATKIVTLKHHVESV